MVLNARRMDETLQGKIVQRRQEDLANLWGTAIFRVVVSPEFLQSRGFWAAFCLQDGVWGLSVSAAAEKEDYFIYLDCKFVWGSKGGGRLLQKGI